MSKLPHSISSSRRCSTNLLDLFPKRFFPGKLASGRTAYALIETGGGKRCDAIWWSCNSLLYRTGSAIRWCLKSSIGHNVGLQ